MFGSGVSSEEEQIVMTRIVHGQSLSWGKSAGIPGHIEMFPGDSIVVYWCQCFGGAMDVMLRCLMFHVG